MKSLSRHLLGLVCALALGGGATSAGDWPQWRGPDRNGVVPASEKTPATLPANPAVVWKMQVGEGLASPVVARGRLVYFDARNGKEVLHCLDAATAKEHWQAEIDDTFSDSQGPSGPRCTPVIDGDRVYAVSCRGELQCLDFGTGKPIWRLNYTRDFGASFIGEKGKAPGASRHGNNGSPLVAGDRLIACAGGTNGAGVVSLNKLTGAVVWKSQNDQAGYAPPILATIQGVPQIICFTAEGLIGLREKNGELLWRHPMKTDFARHVTTPVVYGDCVVVSSHQIGMVGLKISKEGDGLKAEQAWLSKPNAMNFASPVAVGRHLYGLGPARNLICVDIPTGELKWSKEGVVTTSPDKAHAAFIVMGPNILCLTDTGTLAMFAADAGGYKEIGQAQVCAVNWCNPAYADGKLYARDGIKKTGEMVSVALLP